MSKAAVRPKTLVALVGATALGVGGGWLYHAQTRPRLLPPAWSLGQGIDEAAGYLARVNGDDGRFVYVAGSDGRPVTSKYNILRHAGAIYALADYAASDADVAVRATAAAAADRAADQLAKGYTRPLWEEPNAIAVWSEPKEEGGAKRSAKLGGAGLAMIGLLGRIRTADASVPDVSTVQKLGRFVLFMQHPDGGFDAKYTESGKRPPTTSLYYPGEAILGLAMLYETDHDPRWLDSALRGVARLVASRRGATSLPSDHWLMIAIDRLVPLFGDAKTPPLTRDEMLGHAVALGERMIDEQLQTLAEHPELDGCFTSDGRTTPSATRLEGLLALEHALATDPPHAPIRATVRASIARGIGFLRRAQITSGPLRGGVPLAVPGVTASPSIDNEGDDESASATLGTVRIDYVQHALSAFMRYRRMCSADPSACPP